ncbi:hypothetical protein HYH03_003432 [Edaphochlamys debaryana]|uniref:Uncharacterized protein n=1 Tax=Edaphochlamys debaryana TaxID=47281 RepID=A0A835Y9B6_9CHLO|nr:hypothetical protein HYH03_003432 [Edaphochlamys debaryana]|eukprot:KAG2498692.1 hypothetical protein HYH03_003432 [Edaphochlamys debaryana]
MVWSRPQLGTGRSREHEIDERLEDDTSKQLKEEEVVKFDNAEELLGRFEGRSPEELLRVNALTLTDSSHDGVEAGVVAELLRTTVPHLCKVDLRCMYKDTREEVLAAVASMPNLMTLRLPGFDHVEGLTALTSLADAEYVVPAWAAGEAHRKPVRLLLDYAPKSLEKVELGTVALAEDPDDLDGLELEINVLMTLRKGSLVAMEVASLGSRPAMLLEQVLASRAAPKGRLPLLRYRKEDKWGAFEAGTEGRYWRRLLARCDRVEDAEGRPSVVELEEGDDGDSAEEERSEVESEVDDDKDDQPSFKAEEVKAEAPTVRRPSAEARREEASGLDMEPPAQPLAPLACPLLPCIKPDPDAEPPAELGPGPIGPIPGPLLSPDQPPVPIKTEPGTAPGEARFSHVWSLPYDAAELAALRRRYLEPRVVTVEISSATRSGAVRMSSKQRKCRPAAEQSYERLWPHLQSLSEDVDEEAAAAAGGGGAAGAPSALAAALLAALRILRAYEAACGLDAAPRDAALSRVLPAYGAEVTAARNAAAEVTAARNAAAEVTSAEMLDLTAEEIDVEAYVLQEWPAEVVARVAVKREAA